MRIFTYGTLMSSQCRATAFLPPRRWDRFPAVAGGRLYSVMDYFPAMVEDPDSLTIGEVIVPKGMHATDDHHQDFLDTMDMELRAGYHLAFLPAQITDENAHPSIRTRESLTFLVKQSQAERLTPIPGNDWNIYERTLRQ